MESHKFPAERFHIPVGVVLAAKLVKWFPDRSHKVGDLFLLEGPDGDRYFIDANGRRLGV